MLGLAEQIGGDPFGIIVGIGDDQNFAGAGNHVDPDHAVELALGLGDPGVTRPGDDIDLGDPLGAIGERGDRLRPADAPDFVDSGNMRGGEHQRIALAFGGRGDDRQPPDPGHLGGDRVHQQRGRIGGAPARHIEPRGIDR